MTGLEGYAQALKNLNEALKENAATCSTFLDTLARLYKKTAGDK